MEYRTEATLEELLAEPIVLALMERDGISLEEARSFYERVTSRARSRQKSKPSRAPGHGGFRPRTGTLQAHIAPCM